MPEALELWPACRFAPTMLRASISRNATLGTSTPTGAPEADAQRASSYTSHRAKQSTGCSRKTRRPRSNLLRRPLFLILGRSSRMGMDQPRPPMPPTRCLVWRISETSWTASRHDAGFHGRRGSHIFRRCRRGSASGELHRTFRVRTRRRRIGGKARGALAATHRLGALGPGIAYWTGPTLLVDPLLSCFEVEAVLPFDLKKLKSLLRERNAGPLEIKVRGVEQDPADLRKRLATRRHAALFAFAG